MEPVRNYLIAGMILLPSLVMAATDCQIIEYPDHYAAVCVGDEKTEPVLTQKPMDSLDSEGVQVQPAAKAPVVKKAVKAESAPVAVQQSMTESARLATKAAGAQPSVPLQGKEPVAGQTGTVRFPVATGQPQNDMGAAKVANDSKFRGKGKISFVTRMKNNLAVSSMSKH